MLTIKDIERVCDTGTDDEHATVARIARELTDLEKHNGWPNRETWLVNLWLSNNDAATNETCREIAKGTASDMEAGEAIREWIETEHGQEPADMRGLWGDLINQALARVDWRAIGAAFRPEE